MESSYDDLSPNADEQKHYEDLIDQKQTQYDENTEEDDTAPVLHIQRAQKSAYDELDGTVLLVKPIPKQPYDEFDDQKPTNVSQPTEPYEDALATSFGNMSVKTGTDCSVFDSNGDQTHNVQVLAEILQQGIFLNTIKHRGCSRDFALFALKTIGAGNSKAPIASGCLNGTPCINKIAVKMTSVMNPSDPNDSGLRESEWLKVLYEDTVAPRHSPHIMPYLSSFVCTGDVMREAKLCFTYNQDKLSFMNSLNSLKSNNINVIISSFAAPGNLLRVLAPLITIPANEKLLVKVLRVVLFQVFWTLVCIQKQFPGFRHNDLHPGNVLVMNDADVKSLYSISDEKSYYIDKSALPGYENTSVKFWDFEYACSKEMANSGLRPGLGMINDGNLYYDVHFFLNYLFLEVPQRKIGYAQSFFDFLDRVLPEQVRGGIREVNGVKLIHATRLTEQGQQQAKQLGLKTASELLDDDFFEPLRVDAETKIDQFMTHRYDMPQ